MKNTTLLWIFGGVALAGAAATVAYYVAKPKEITASTNAGTPTPAGGQETTTPAPAPHGSYDVAIGNLVNAVAPMLPQSGWGHMGADVPGGLW